MTKWRIAEYAGAESAYGALLVVGLLLLFALKALVMPETMKNQSQRSDRQEIFDHAEGVMTQSVEYQMAKMPSDVWLGAALGSIGLALYLKLSGKREDSLFVGQWAAPFLLIGVYMKLVKIGGSDRVRHNS